MSPEYSVIQFNTQPEIEATPLLPVQAASDLAFFCASATVVELAYYTAQVERIAAAASSQTATSNQAFVALTGDLGVIMAPGDVFRLGYRDGANALQLSNLFIFEPIAKDYSSLIEYRCAGNEYGFNYADIQGGNRVRVAIRLHSPNPVKEQKIYNRNDGTKKILYSKIEKQWELETEYYPESIHDKIIIALAHDELLINGADLTSTGDYSIDWPNGYQLEDGTWVAKATAKIQGTKAIRNSNC